MSDCRFGVSPVNFPDPELSKYVTNITGEPKYKYGQQEQVTVRNTVLERSVFKYLWGGGGGA